MPFQSIYPLLTSAGVLVAAIGITAIDADWDNPGIHWKLGVTLVGGAIAFVGAYLWSLEGVEGYHLHPEGDGPAPDAHAKH